MDYGMPSSNSAVVTVPSWFDPAKNKFRVKEMPVKIKEIMKKAGITPQDLRNKRSAIEYFTTLC